MAPRLPTFRLDMSGGDDVRPERHLLIKCQKCGCLESLSITVFSFSGRRPAKLRCSCGAIVLTVLCRAGSTYALHLDCLVCESPHIVTFTAKEFWHNPMLPIVCPSTMVETGFIGNPDRIAHSLSVQKTLSELLPSDDGIDDFFINPDVMYQVLSHLHEIAKSGNLYCECGNDNIEIDLYSDKLELRCPTCDSLSIVYAENDDDLAVMGRVAVIEMKQAGFTSVDASRFNPKHIRR